MQKKGETNTIPRVIASDSRLCVLQIPTSPSSGPVATSVSRQPDTKVRLFDCVRSSGSQKYESYGTDPIAQNDRLCAKRDNQRPGARDCASTSAYWSGARPRHDTSGGFVWRAMPFRGFISRGLLSESKQYYFRDACSACTHARTIIISNIGQP